jgi:hypothetical protein
LRRNHESPRPGSRPSLLTPAQQADASRNGISLNLRSGSAAAKPPPRPSRRLLGWGGLTLGVLAMLAGGGAWYSQSRSGDQPLTNVASAAPTSNSKTVNLADVPAAEVLAAAPAAAINDEVPASPKGMPGADAEPAPKAGADVLSKALETPSLAAAAKPVDAPANGGHLAPEPELKKTPAKPQPQPQRRAKPKSTKPDSDVTLLAALMAHAQANPESKKTAPRLQTQLQQCQKMSSPAAEKCHVRVCAGRTKTHAECKPVKVAGTGAA